MVKNRGLSGTLDGDDISINSETPYSKNPQCYCGAHTPFANCLINFFSWALAYKLSLVSECPEYTGADVTYVFLKFGFC